MEFHTIAVLAALIVSAYFAMPFIIEKRRKQSLASKIPAHHLVPIFGNSLSFARVTDMKELWNVIHELTSKFSGIQRLCLGPVLAIVVDKPEYARMVSIKCPNKHPWYYLLSFAKNGIFVTPDSHGSHYERLRKALSSSLHPKNLVDWHDFVATKALQASYALGKMEGKGEFDVSKLTLAYALDVTCKVVLGVDPDEMEENKFNFHHFLQESVALGIQRVVKPQYFIDFIFEKTQKGREFEEHCWGATALSKDLSQRRINELQIRGINLKSDFQVENYMDAVIKVGYEQGLSPDEIARMMSDVPMAGSDTTGTLSAFTLLFLAMYPQYQQEAFEEQIAVLGDATRPPTIEELGRMPFLACIEKEVLRLQGPPMVFRYSEDEIDIGGYTVPKGTTYAISMHKIHRNPEFYEKPNEFYPYHFLTKNVDKRPKNTFLPYSNGRRRCPGAQFSHLMYATLISVLLRNYEFSTSRTYDEIEYKYSLMLASSFGYPLQIKRRTK